MKTLVELFMKKYVCLVKHLVENTWYNILLKCLVKHLVKNMCRIIYLKRYVYNT